jgi:hypothetical protein
LWSVLKKKKKIGEYLNIIFILFLCNIFFFFRVCINVNEYEMSYQFRSLTFRCRKMDFSFGFWDRCIKCLGVGI